MQFSTVAIVAAIAASAQAGSTITKVDTTSTLVTISECDSTVTDCPYKSSTAANTTTHGVSTYSAGAAVNGQYAAGFAAVAAGALLAIVYEVLLEVPYGRITSYGHIAFLIGRPENSRRVGQSLKHMEYIHKELDKDSKARGDTIFKLKDLPWWRVLSSSGRISQRARSNAIIEQKQLLESEGVFVSDEFSVDKDEYGWFPDDVDIGVSRY